MKDKVVLVLDKKEYKINEVEYINVLKCKYTAAEIIYTEYEDNTIRKVRNWKIVGSLLQHILYWKKSYNYAKEVMQINASTIICINPIVGIFLGIKNRNQNVNIILCGFLFEPKSNKIYYWLRKMFTEQCLKGIRYAVVYAEQELAYYNNIFVNFGKFVYVQYGIDYLVENRYLGKLPDKYIYSGGGSNRDYYTLVNAYNLLRLKSKVPELCIATTTRCLAGIDTRNIHVLNDVVLETFGDIMKNAEFLILSLKDTEISAGHQVLLEAMKNNVIILVNRIKAIENYVGDNNVVFYKSGDINDLQDKINYVLNNYEMLKRKTNKNITYYENNYTFSHLLERVINLEV